MQPGRPWLAASNPQQTTEDQVGRRIESQGSMASPIRVRCTIPRDQEEPGNWGEAWGPCFDNGANLSAAALAYLAIRFPYIQRFVRVHAC